MSRGPWNVSKRILRDIYRWNNDSPSKANLKTLERLVQSEADEILVQTILQLQVVEDRYGEHLPDDPPRIPCPICKSVKYLVPTDRPKILICDRPTCTYKRAIKSRNSKIERSENVS